MKSRLSILMFLFIVFIGLQSFAQERIVKGTVTDDSGMPLPGVSVVVKGTTTGVETDFDGKYTIKALANQTLVFSMTGMNKHEIPASSTTINVKMKENVQQIDEVVVIGYGKQSKRLITDNVVKLSSESLKEVPNPNFQNALVGKAAGVRVNQTNGKLESGFNINIRGSASISASTQPLYVIDGIPMINSDESTNGAPVNPLVTLSSTEIESIEILKDASSAAIYGSRGSNGVVLITTKTGKKGKPAVSFNLSQGFSSPTNKVEWLNSKEYVELFLEAGRNVGAESFVVGRLNRYSNNTDWRNNAIDTDWHDYIFRDGSIRDADFSVSGGDTNYSYMFTASNNKTEGIIRKNNLERNSARLNVSANITEKIKFGLNLGYSNTDIERVSNDNQFTTPMQAIALAPISPAFLSDGEPFAGTTYANFLLADKYGNYNTNVKRITGKLFGEYKLLKNLTFHSDYGFDTYIQKEKEYQGKKFPFMSTDGYAFNSNVETVNNIFSNYLTYNFEYGKNNFTVLGGYEYNKSEREFTSVTGIRFPSDDFQNIDSAGEITAGSGNVTEFSFTSIFGRLEYNFDNKYLLKVSVRRDGSSRFGSNNRYGIFPAVSAGWIISKESFLMDNKYLSFLKLRASWGETGNAEIGNFASRSLWNATTYRNNPGIVPSQPGNNDLTWEKSSQVDIGIDFGLFENKITGELDYYNKDTNGLLFSQNLPFSSGYSSINRNIGDLRNRGFEFVFNTKNINKDNFKWYTSFNIANNENEVISLPDNNADVFVGSYLVRRVGERLDSFYLVEYAGVDPANGDALFYKNTLLPNGQRDRTTTNDYSEAQRVVSGNSSPLWIGGITNNFIYRNFDLSFTFQGEFGASIYNAAGKWQSANGDWFDNQTIDQMDRWRNSGDITNVPQARLDSQNGTQESTRYLEEANFIRLRNLSFGYSFNNKLTEKIGITKLRIYFTAINALTFTNYKNGYDPESRTDASRGAGTTFYSAPPAKTFSFGINVNF